MKFRRSIAAFLAFVMLFSVLGTAAAAGRPHYFANGTDYTTEELMSILGVSRQDLADIQCSLYEAVLYDTVLDLSPWNIEYTSGVYDAIWEIVCYDFAADMISGIMLESREENGKVYVDHVSFHYKALYDKELQDFKNILFGSQEFLCRFRRDASLTDLELALLVHDQLVANYEYDVYFIYGDDTYYANGLFGNGMGVCNAYAEAYRYIMLKLGIHCEMIISRDLNHAWNIIELDGQRYHVDCTWDDPINDRSGNVRHVNFLRSTTGITATGHNTTDYDSSPVSTKYDSAFWQSVESSFCYLDGNIYYINSSQKLCTWNDGVSKEIYSLPKNGSSWARAYSKLGTDGNRLFFSTPTAIYEYFPRTNTASVIYQPTLVSGHSIIGFRVKENKFIIEPYHSAYFADSTKANYQITYTYQAEPANNHVYQDGKVLVPATCMSPGTMICSCIYCCHKSTKAITSGSHSPFTTQGTPPTCTTIGWTGGQYCSLCGTILKSSLMIPMTDHRAVSKAGIAPTCTKEGHTAGTVCADCGTVLSGCEKLPKTGHKEETLTGYGPTCTKPGESGGTMCSVCGMILEESRTIPATGHTSQYKAGVAPGCVTAGVSEGTVCTRCGVVLSGCQVLPATGHKKTVIPGKKPDCTNSGQSDGIYCYDCGEILVEQSYLPKTGHTEVIDKAVAATCTTTGLTEGSHCSVCNAVIRAQTTVPLADHNYSYKVSEKPGETTTGVLTGVCSNCGVKHTVTMPALNSGEYKRSTASTPTCTKSGSETCFWSNKSYGSIHFMVGVPAKGHQEVTDPAVEPTCTAPGYTEGSHCSVCNEKIKAQQEIPALSHQYAEKRIDPTCTDRGYSIFTCSRCSHSYKGSYVKATGHCELSLPGKQPTCTEPGWDGGSMCIDCDLIIQDYKDLPATGHTVVTDPAVEPDCSTPGLTEGSHCSVCKQVFQKQEVIPKTGHSYIYTDLGRENHTVTCKNCDYEILGSHKYTEGSCVCGGKEPVEAVVDPKLELHHSLNLASDMAINYIVPKASLNGYDMDTVYMESTLDLYDGNRRTGSKTVTIKGELRGNYFYFIFSGVAAVQMNDRICSVLYGTRDGQRYCSPVDDYSVTDYAYTIFHKASATDELKTACMDLLRYGAKAQVYKGYRTDALADAQMTEEHRAYLTDLNTVSLGGSDMFIDDLPNASVTWAGKSLDLNSKICLKFVFNTTAYTGKVEDLKLRLSYRNIDGKSVTVTLGGPQSYSGSNKLYAFTVDSLLVPELRKEVAVQIFAGDTPVSCTLVYSADAYGINKTGALKDLCKALFAYSDSAKAYFIQ